MRPIYPKILLFILPYFIFCSVDAQTLNEVDLRYDSFMNAAQFHKYRGYTTKDIKAIPKYDRPDLAADQDFYMTVNPNTLKVPSEKRYDIMRMVDSINNATSIGYTAITGVDWTERGPDNFGGRTRALMFDPTDSANGYKKVWAGGVAGGLWYIGDITSATQAWSKVDDFWTNMAVSCIVYDPTDDSTFYVGTGEGWSNADAVRGNGIWKTEDAGQSWAQLSSTTTSTFRYVNKIQVTSTGRVLVATTSGLLYSDNGGTSWTTYSTSRFADIEIAANGDVYASQLYGSSGGNIFKSTNNGTSFTSVYSPTAGTIRRIELACAPSDSNVVYAVSGNSSNNVAWIKKSSNGGTSWSNVAIPKYQNDTTKDFCRGQVWYDLIMAVHPSNSSTLLVGGIDLHKSTNSGTSWTPVSHWYGGFSKPYVHADQHAMAFRPGASNEMIFGNDGGVSYSANAGSSSSPSFSTRINGYNVTQFYSAAMKDSMGSNYMLAGAQDNGSHKFTNSGVNSTTRVTGGDGGFCFIDQDNPTYQITSYVYNNWRRSTNGGSSFSAITSNNTGRFINPSDYDDDANILYAASGSNQIYRVSGITGTLSASTLTVGGSALGGVQASHIRCSPYSNNTLFVGNSSAKVFKISNAHSSPTSVNLDPNSDLPTSGYISCIEVGASDSQLLVTLSNYGVVSVWETEDGGSSWVNKEGNLPDMPVRWALYNPNDRNQVLLATEVGVWSTDNLAASSVDWDPTNTGLANVRCDMMQIRSTDNMIAIATHGRGLFTTDVFGDTSIVANFNASNNTPCVNFSVNLSNLSSGGYTKSLWEILPSTFSYINGTDSTSENPSIKFTSSGQYSIKLVCSNNTGTDIDSITKTNVINVQATPSFSNWKQDFDQINTISSTALDSIWTLNYDADYPWEIDSNYTASTNTGPYEDYSGSGHFLYTEGSYPADSGDIAIIESSCIAKPDTGYFYFGYHMFGTGIESLLIEADTGSGWSTLTTLSGEQQLSYTDSWKKGAIDVGNFAGESYRMRILAERGANYESDIALDEIEFSTTFDTCAFFGYANCRPTTLSKIYDDGVYGVKIGTTEYTSSGVDVDGEYTDGLCSEQFVVSSDSFVLNVNAGKTYSDRVRVFIDYNNDHKFDTINEMVWFSGKSIGYRSDTIHIPSTAVFNKMVRMRIMADDDSTLPNNPCAQLKYGETQDFGIKFDKLCNLSIDLGQDTAQCGDSVVLSTGSFVQYFWSTGASSSSISASTGNYSVTVTDGNGCTASDTIGVTIHNLPIANLGADTSQCGDSVTLNAGTFSSYAWSTGASSSSIAVSTTGNYNVTVTDGNGCIDSDTIGVTIHNLPIANLGADTSQCGDSVTLNAGTFSSYAWSTGASSSSISASTTSSYSVTVTDGNGCTDSDTIGVTIHNLPIANLGADTSQCGGSITLNAGTFGSYAWSTGASSSSIAVSTGNYNVTVTDGNGCTDSDTIGVTIQSLPNVNLGPDTTQCSGFIFLSPGSFNSYTWSNGSNQSFITAFMSGNYWVTATDTNGCVATDSIQISIFNNPVPNLGLDTTQCGGSVALYPGLFIQYDWNTGNSSSIETVDSSGTYSVIVTDSNGCIAKDSIQVTIHSLPTVNLGVDTTQCGGSVTLNAGTFSSYAWSTGAFTSSIAASTTGNYDVTITDGNGCTDSDTMGVTIHSLPSVNLGLDTSQCGGSIILNAGTFSSYAWSTGATTNSITASTTSSYNVTVTDGNGCTDKDTIEVNIYSLPSVNLGADTSQCGGSIILNAGTFSSYAWSTGATTTSITASTTDSYNVTVTDGNGCQDKDTIEVTLYILEDDFLKDDTTLCRDETLDAKQGANFLWHNGETTQIISASISEKYWVNKTDNNGCVISDTINVTVIQFPKSDFSFQEYNEFATSFMVDFTNESENATEIEWQFGDDSTSIENNPTHIFKLGAYEVTLIVKNDCGTDTSRQSVAHTSSVKNLENQQLKVYPNPTKDGVYLQSLNNSNIESYELIDVLGKPILKSTKSEGYGKETYLDLRSILNGTYYLKVKSNDTIRVIKLEVVR